MTPRSSKRRHCLISPLRYPGSKRCLVDYVRDVIQQNELKPSLFVEPFAGGASVALQLLRWDVVDKIVLMDADPLVASFWNVVFRDSEWLIQQVWDAEVTLQRWSELKKTLATSNLTTDRERAFACLFLNRTSFSGILAQGAGPIGGKAQESAYPIDCRFPRKTLARRIKNIACLKNKVDFIWCIDWRDGMKRLKKNRSKEFKNAFFYFDPPFFEKAEDLYRCYFTGQQHIELRDYLLHLKQPWLLSYDSVSKVEELYETPSGKIPKRLLTHSTHIDLIYTTNHARRVAREVIISNLALPEETIIGRQAPLTLDSAETYVNSQELCDANTTASSVNCVAPNNDRVLQTIS